VIVMEGDGDGDHETPQRGKHGPNYDTVDDATSIQTEVSTIARS